MNKKLLIFVLVFTLVFSFVGCDSGNSEFIIPSENHGVNSGKVISKVDGNTNEVVFDYESEKEMLSDMKIAVENNKFQLYYSEDSMAIAIVDKASGKIMSTNPYNAARDETYSGSIASTLNSQLVLTYLQNETDLMSFYSADDCANLGQYKINLHENGISFDMSIGLEKDNSYIPKIISPKRYKEICSKLSDDDIETLEMFYTLYTVDEFDASGVKDIYPELKKQELYCCLYELRERDEEKLNSILGTAKYGKKEYESDMSSFGLKGADISFPNFKLSLYYALTENGVSVSIPAESLEYNEEFPLLEISLLPYFGAEEPSAKSKGYLFIPDGSGAIINLNNDDEAHRSIITGTVYGTNASELPQKTIKEVTMQYYLPVFGTVKDNNTALFGLISSGDADTKITAHLGKPNGNFYATNAEFVLSNYEKYTKISGVDNPWSDKVFYLCDKNVLKDDMTVDYYMLTNENANYSAFASIYNEYLFGDKEKSKDFSAIHIETLGSVLTEKNFIVFDYDGETVLTDYEQNIKILKELSAEGRNDYSLQLRGWQENGLDSSVSSELQFSSELGGKEGVIALRDYCNEKDIPFLLYNNLSYVKFDRSFDDFKLKNDAARTLELLYAETQSAITNSSKNKNYVVTPGSYKKYISSLYSSAKDNELTNNLDLGQIGCALNTDYSKDRLINRSQSKKLVVEALKSTKNYSFGFEGANAYVLPYADAVNGIVYENSGFAGESATVPFLQLVLGDNVVCRSDAINLKDDSRDALLGCIESGTVPTYLLSYDNTSKLKVTDYTGYYAVDFQILKKSIIENYDYIKAAVKAKGDGGIVAHKILADGVTYTEYQNGNGVYVNRTDKDYTADGIIVGAMDYVVKE